MADQSKIYVPSFSADIESLTLDWELPLDYKPVEIRAGNFDSDDRLEVAARARSKEGSQEMFIYDIDTHRLKLLFKSKESLLGDCQTFTTADLNGDGTDEIFAQTSLGKIEVFNICDQPINNWSSHHQRPLQQRRFSRVCFAPADSPTPAQMMKWRSSEITMEELSYII